MMLKKSMLMGSVAMTVVLLALSSGKKKQKLDIQEHLVSETETFLALIDGPPEGGYRYFFNAAYRYKDAVVIFFKKMCKKKEDDFTPEDKAFILNAAFENMLAFKRFLVKNCDKLNVKKYIVVDKLDYLQDDFAVSLADVCIETGDKELGTMVQARMQDGRFDELKMTEEDHNQMDWLYDIQRKKREMERSRRKKFERESGNRSE
jgi:hypothetical protein